MKELRIRAITVGTDLFKVGGGHAEERFRSFYEGAEKLFAARGIEVQTRRMVFAPIDPATNPAPPSVTAALGSASAMARNVGIRWLCLPLWAKRLPQSELSQIIVPVIRRFPNLFMHFLATHDREIVNDALLDVSKYLLNISKLSNNGYDNFRVGVGCNVVPNTPFFPFSWHQGNTGFSVAVETIGAVLSILDRLSSNASLSEVRSAILEELIAICFQIESICREIAGKFCGIEYKGADISLAPFPDGRKSVGAVLERLAPEHFGDSGSLTGTAFLTHILKEAVKESGMLGVGFNGVMYSPLEDDRLAARMGRTLTLEKLMLFSTVCGCGVDMVPIPGDTLPEDIASIIQDTATLSLVLNKPLGVRVLPIPMGNANQMTQFNHDFLVNCRIQQTSGMGLMRHLGNIRF